MPELQKIHLAVPQRQQDNDCMRSSHSKLEGCKLEGNAEIERLAFVWIAFNATYSGDAELPVFA